MRITGGSLRGRTLVWPKSKSVRPMSDKVREALFNILGDLTGQTGLDVYAGSGSVGLEAISRGAKLVEAVEKLPASQRVIQQNVDALRVSDQYVLNTVSVEDWLGWAANQAAQARYNFILADPPYTQVKAEILDRLAEFLVPDGLLVLSHTSKMNSPQLENLKLIDHRTYGDSALSFYR